MWNNTWDYETVLEEEKERITDILKNHLQHFKSIKFYISINIPCKKNIEDAQKVVNFRSSSTSLIEGSNISEV